MRSRAHLAWLETALNLLTLALVAATVVLLAGLLSVVCARNCGATALKIASERLHSSGSPPALKTERGRRAAMSQAPLAGILSVDR
jgi:hypothetical protein